MRRYLIAGSILVLSALSCALPTELVQTALEEAEQATGGDGLGPTPTPTLTPTPTPAPLAGGVSSSGEGAAPSDRQNPFTDPQPDAENFPPLGEIPPDAGQYDMLKAGSWTGYALEGAMTCEDIINLPLLPVPPQTNTVEIVDDQSFVLSGLGGIEEGQTSTVTFIADPGVRGLFHGVYTVSSDGDTFDILYHVQLVTDEHIIGYMEGHPVNQGYQCDVYRAYEAYYTGG